MWLVTAQRVKWPPAQARKLLGRILGRERQRPIYAKQSETDPKENPTVFASGSGPSEEMARSMNDKEHQNRLLTPGANLSGDTRDKIRWREVEQDAPYVDAIVRTDVMLGLGKIRRRSSMLEDPEKKRPSKSRVRLYDLSTSMVDFAG